MKKFKPRNGMGHRIPHPLPLALHTLLLEFCVENDDGHDTFCWEWQGSTDKDGYAQVKYRGKKYRASRLAYAAYVGELLDGNDVDHECMNRKCINPKHLAQVDYHTNRVVLRNERLVESATHPVPF